VSTQAESPPGDAVSDPHEPSVDVGRIGWMLIVLTLLAGGLILVLRREWGYAAVTGAVALSALINVF
jgi:hypothetical protein